MRALLQTARRLLSAATMLYCIALLVLALLWTLGIRGRWWVDLPNIFALYLFAPLLLLVPAAIRSPKRALHSLVLIASGVFLGLFGPRMIPPAAQTSDGPRVRVATFNLHYSLLAPQVADTIAAIQAQRADVVMLQELSPEAATAIQQHLAGDYPYQALAPSIGYTGMGLLSRYPLDAQPRQDFSMQTALLRVDDRSITLINVSLTAPEVKLRRLPLVHWVKRVRAYRTTKRASDLEALLRAVDSARGPLIVGGDFNLSDREPDYAQLAGRLHDAYRETNWGFGHTFPSSLSLAGEPIRLPLIRIDYIWSAGGALPAATETACGAVSDHCLVVADLRLAGHGEQAAAAR